MKTTLLMLMLMAAMGLTAVTQAATVTLPGDIDGDGDRDATDAQLVLDVLVGAQVADTPPAVNFTSEGDVNDDGVINNLDAILMLGVISGKIAPPLDPLALTVFDNGDGTVTVAGATGAVPGGRTVNLINATSDTVGTVTADPDGGFQGSISAATGDVITVGIDNEPFAITVIVGDPSSFILGLSRLGDASQHIQ